MLLVSACSTAPATPPTARVDPALLVEPQKLPLFPRNPDGTINGGQCITGGIELYDVAGKIRHDFMALQAQVKAMQAPEAEPRSPRP